MMSTVELLNVEPVELKFPSQETDLLLSLQLLNKTDNYVAFKFSKESGHVVEECKLRVVYVSPPQPFSPVPEGSEEGCSPRGSVSENGHFGASDSGVTRSLIAKLTKEKNAAIQQNNRLRQELELLKREASKGQGGVSFLIVVLVGLIGVILGYIMKA